MRHSAKKYHSRKRHSAKKYHSTKRHSVKRGGDGGDASKDFYYSNLPVEIILKQFENEYDTVLFAFSQPYSYTEIVRDVL